MTVSRASDDPWEHARTLTTARIGWPAVGRVGSRSFTTIRCGFGVSKAAASGTAPSRQAARSTHESPTVEPST